MGYRIRFLPVAMGYRIRFLPAHPYSDIYVQNFETP